MARKNPLLSTPRTVRRAPAASSAVRSAALPAAPFAAPAAQQAALPVEPAPDPLAALLEEEARRAPSLPIILISAAFGISAGIIGFYLAYGLAHLRVEWSAAAGALFLCFGVGASGAVLTSATGSRAALPNIGLSCGLILLTFIFFSTCMLVGAVAATLLIALRI